VERKEEMRIARQKRYEQQARDIAAKEVKCAGCNKDFKHGTRFWVCRKCKGECRSQIHPSYVKKRKVKEGDLESGEKEWGLGDDSTSWRSL
jgi:hypothetical protein